MGKTAPPGLAIDTNRIDVLSRQKLSDSDGLADPPGIVWERTGSLTHVIEELLSLPAPNDRLAPQLLRATCPKLWTP
jgi:hypothetical protein